MRRVADTVTIFEQTSCEEFHLIKLFSVCVSDAICKEIEWRTMFLHWLLNSECNHDLKLISDFLDSRNIRSTLEDMIFHETQYYCCLQSNSYMRKWWKIHCVLNIMRLIWTTCDAFWFEEWTQHLSALYQWQVSWFSQCLCDCVHWWHLDLLIHVIWTLKTCTNDTWTATRNWLAI